MFENEKFYTLLPPELWRIVQQIRFNSTRNELAKKLQFPHFSVCGAVQGELLWLIKQRTSTGYFQYIVSHRGINITFSMKVNGRIYTFYFYEERL